MDDILLPVFGDDGSSSTTNSTITIPIAGADVDEQSCSLLGPVGLLVQALMAVLVLCSLVLKRYRENPRRAWPVWLADVSKQILGQGFLHASNILISTALSHHTEEDACTAYFVSIFVDCTLGVLIIYAGMRTLSYVAIRKMHIEGCKTGQYYHAVHSHKQIKASSSVPVSPHANKITVFSAADDHDDNDHDGPLSATVSLNRPLGGVAQSDAFQFSWWGKQLLIYLLSLCIMKLALLAFFLIPEVFDVGDWLLSWLGYDTRIVFVLMIFPLCMNAFQFMVVDTILKSQYLPHDGIDSGFTTNPDNSMVSQVHDPAHDDDDDDHERQAFLGRSRVSSEGDIEQGRCSQPQAKPEVSSSPPPYSTEATRSLRETAAAHRSQIPSPQLPKSNLATRPPIIHITSASAERVPTLLSEKLVTELRNSYPAPFSKSTGHVLQQTGPKDGADHGWDWLDEDENENEVATSLSAA